MKDESQKPVTESYITNHKRVFGSNSRADGKNRMVGLMLEVALANRSSGDVLTESQQRLLKLYDDATEETE